MRALLFGRSRLIGNPPDNWLHNHFFSRACHSFSAIMGPTWRTPEDSFSVKTARRGADVRSDKTPLVSSPITTGTGLMSLLTAIRAAKLWCQQIASISQITFVVSEAVGHCHEQLAKCWEQNAPIVIFSDNTNIEETLKAMTNVPIPMNFIDVTLMAIIIWLYM